MITEFTDSTAHWFSKDFSVYVNMWEVTSYHAEDHGLVVNLKLDRTIVIKDTDDAVDFIETHTACREWAASA